jgi:AbrB family looped-hinge helix DNA binding protein
MSIVKIMQHGQITIPKKIREALGIKEGDMAEAELENDRIVITPKRLVKDKALEELFALMDSVHERNRSSLKKRWPGM